MNGEDVVRIDRRFIPRRGDSVHTVEIDGEAVLLDQSSNRLLHLNATACVVWACIDGHSSLEEIAADLAVGLGASRDTVVAETIELVRMLGGEGMLAGIAPRRITPGASRPS